MTSSLSISFLFLDPRFHGRGDGGEPEWPPSPLRAFQALVAAAGAMQRGRSPRSEVQAALHWLERVCEASTPLIVAPGTLPHSTAYRLSVPNNALDLVARAWSRGNYSTVGDANPATHRAMKTIRPTRLREDEAIHFLFRLGDPVTPGEAGHVEVLKAIAGSVAALGWGIDLVVARASVLNKREVDALAGERWVEGTTRRNGLRVPIAGTLDALEQHHRGFLDRIHGDIWKSPPTFSRFKVVAYNRPEDIEQRAYGVFALRDTVDPNRFRSFEPTRSTVIVAGRLRHATHQAALVSKMGEWSESEVAAFVLGHGEPKGDPHRAPGRRRFAYLPLPTIHARGPGSDHVGAIRRVLVTTLVDGCEGEVAWAERALAGCELIDEQTNACSAILEPITAPDTVVDRFVPDRGASVWASVTPVVLPGYDDPGHLRRRLAKGVSVAEQRKLIEQLESRTDALLRKAIVQAGISAELAANAILSWQRPGFLSGVQPATGYRVPQHLVRFPRLHVRIEWRDACGASVLVRGPICIGGGRFYGMGLFAAVG
jgi:CRISPR-associated protein Csb2